jgi:hypothetical protein
MRELVHVTRPSGPCASPTLNGSGVWHCPEHPSDEEMAGRARADPGALSFDPLIWRKVFHPAQQAGFEVIDVHIRPYHLIAGRAQPEVVRAWTFKATTLGAPLRLAGWRAAERCAGFSGGMLRDEQTFSYSTLISVKGRVPSAYIGC